MRRLNHLESAICAIAMAGLALFLEVPPTLAGPLEDALSLYNSGQEAAAIPLLRTLADAGNTKAEDTLSHIYYYGEGTPVDYAESHKWAMKSATIGDPRGENDLAGDYSHGYGVPIDQSQSIIWYQKAATGGDTFAEVSLAMRYLSGEYVQRDIGLAVKFFREAADHGDERALYAMGTMAHSGFPGVAQDDSAAFHFFSLAAEQSYPAAMSVVGSLYGRGLGVPRDEVESAMWLKLAANHGCEVARGSLILLTMTDGSEIAHEAAQKAAAWDRSHPPRDRHNHNVDPIDGACHVVKQN